MDSSEKNILKKFKNAYERYLGLKTALSSADFSKRETVDQMKTFKSIELQAQIYEVYLRNAKQLEECDEILADPSHENDYMEMATEEKQQLLAEQRKTLRRMEHFFSDSNPEDDNGAIIEIRAGTGGEEASLFASDLLRAYLHYAAKKNLRHEFLSASLSDTKGYKEVVVLITGDKAYKTFKAETGVHRVQRVPQTESSGRIHTSTITVAVLLEAKEQEVVVQDSDLKIDTYRASGAGGQHVNKTDSAVRITHLPTGLVVTCQDEKSQIKNKSKAMKVLRARLFERAKREQKEERDQARKQQVGTGDRAEKIRTYNFPQGRITDHRIGKTLHKLDLFLEGNMEELVAAMWAHEKEQKIASST